MSVWYFAYGSNMDEDRLRCRNLRVIRWRRGRLMGYRLVFNKPCSYGGCANIEPHEGGVVEGVLYLVPSKDLRKLDEFEPGYGRRIFRVETDEEVIEAWAYVATDTEAGLEPSEEYLEYLIRGARQHGLSREYISHLERRGGRSTTF